MYKKQTMGNKKNSGSCMERFMSEIEIVYCDYDYVLMEEGKLEERRLKVLNNKRYIPSFKNNISKPNTGLFYINKGLNPAPRRVSTFENDDI